MRRHTAAFVILLDLVLLLVIANAGSTAPTDQARRAAARRAADHPAAAGLAPANPADLFTINDGFVSKSYAHLGKPANGVLVAETWGRPAGSARPAVPSSPTTPRAWCGASSSARCCGWRYAWSCGAPTTPATTTWPPPAC